VLLTVGVCSLCYPEPEDVCGNASELMKMKKRKMKNNENS